MREILFRGKSTQGDGWVEGSYMEHYFSSRHGRVSAIFWNDDSSCQTYRTPVVPETVGQYTGLTDKNGKKIFEGDIVRVCLDPEICVGNVIWDSEIASYNIPFNNGKCVLPLDIFIAKNKVGDKVWIEVIGNIHDNPDLLDEK